MAQPTMTKFDRLTAVLDDFHHQLATEPNEVFGKLRHAWAAAKQDYANALAMGAVTKSAIASGLEQGIRETPLVLCSLPKEVRVSANRALALAINRHAPDFHKKDQERLAKIISRGSVKSEAEYHLVRHQIDVLEVTIGEASTLSTLYALENGFQAR